MFLLPLLTFLALQRYGTVVSERKVDVQTGKVVKAVVKSEVKAALAELAEQAARPQRRELAEAQRLRVRSQLVVLGAKHSGLAPPSYAAEVLLPAEVARAERNVEEWSAAQREREEARLTALLEEERREREEEKKRAYKPFK